MFHKSSSLSKLREMGCCSCLGFTSKPKRPLSPDSIFGRRFSEECLLNITRGSDSEATSIPSGSDDEFRSPTKGCEKILALRTQDGMICREVPVKETRQLTRSEDEDGNKMINEYVRVCKIASGSYGKVVLYRSRKNGKQYAIKAFHKSHLLKLRVGPSETAMTDVLREVLIMKMLDHPNVVNLVEVIDDPNTDHFYMVLDYVEGKWVFDGNGPSSALGDIIARRYLRGIVAGLMYLHAHNIVHGDIKPDNLLVTSTDMVKIGDFSVSQVFEDDKDELRRSPGTPVFTAPECCLGGRYHGKVSDTWAVGVTLYCMIVGKYPFLGETLQDTYDKIINNPIHLPEGMDSQLQSLIEGLLCKDPAQRMKLDEVARHPWVVEEEGPIPEYLCLCKRRKIWKA